MPQLLFSAEPLCTIFHVWEASHSASVCGEHLGPLLWSALSIYAASTYPGMCVIYLAPHGSHFQDLLIKYFNFYSNPSSQLGQQPQARKAVGFLCSFPVEFNTFTLIATGYVVFALHFKSHQQPLAIKLVFLTSPAQVSYCIVLGLGLEGR